MSKIVEIIETLKHHRRLPGALKSYGIGTALIAGGLKIIVDRLKYDAYAQTLDDIFNSGDNGVVFSSKGLGKVVFRATQIMEEVTGK